LGNRFRRVLTLSVGHVLSSATHNCPNTRVALSFVEKVLSAGAVHDSFLENLEAIG